MKKWVISGVVLCAVGAALALVRPERELKPELRLLGTVVREGTEMYELEFTNPTSRELVYYGYEASNPSLEFQYWEGGAWREPMGFRCGTGLFPQALPAGGKVRFYWPPPRDHAIRIGLAAQPQGFQYSEVSEFKWLPEKLSAWLVNWQQERNRKRGEELIAWAPPLEVIPMTPAELAVEEALEAGVVMDLENLLEVDRYAAGPPPPSLAPAAPGTPGADPFAPRTTNTPVPVGNDPFGLGPPASP